MSGFLSVRPTAAHDQSIARLNDQVRRQGGDGRIVVTRRVAQHCGNDLASMLHAVRVFDGFTPDNDSHGEHDFGVLEWADARLIWKIDYYDATMRQASPDPSDASLTTRVLTIMLASEY